MILLFVGLLSSVWLAVCGMVGAYFLLFSYARPPAIFLPSLLFVVNLRWRPSGSQFMIYSSWEAVQANAAVAAGRFLALLISLYVAYYCFKEIKERGIFRKKGAET